MRIKIKFSLRLHQHFASFMITRTRFRSRCFEGANLFGRMLCKVEKERVSIFVKCVTSVTLFNVLYAFVSFRLLWKDFIKISRMYFYFLRNWFWRCFFLIYYLEIFIMSDFSDIFAIHRHRVFLCGFAWVPSLFALAHSVFYTPGGHWSPFSLLI